MNKESFMKPRVFIVKEKVAPSEEPQVSLATLAFSRLSKRARPEEPPPVQVPSVELPAKPSVIARRTDPIKGITHSAQQTAMLRALARPAAAPQHNTFTRQALRSRLHELYARAAPGVTEPMYSSFSHWAAALGQYEPFAKRFFGAAAHRLAGRILVALYTWSSEAETMRLAPHQLFDRLMSAYVYPKPVSVHPTCVIISGAHGLGKSEILSFLIGELGWSETHTNDFCYSRPSVAKWLRTVMALRPSFSNQLSLHILENAETTVQQYDTDTDAIVSLVDQSAQNALSHHHSPARIIIVTETVSAWIRALADQANVSVIDIYPTQNVKPSPAFPWTSLLKEADGIPARAIAMLAYGGRADSVGHTVHSVSALICQATVSFQWWDRCETALSTHATALYYLKLSVSKRANWRDALRFLDAHRLVDALTHKQERAQVFSTLALFVRVQMRARDANQTRRDPFDEDASWQRLQEIRKAQQERAYRMH